MASPVKLYQSEMHDNLGFWPTWLPGDPHEIGDVGVLEGGRFRRLTTLAELGIATARDVEGASQDVQYTSSQGTTIKATAGAEVSSLAKAEIAVEFSRRGAFVFHASRLRQRRLGNLGGIGREIVRAHERGRWDGNWLVIEALHTADRATVIVSEDSSAGIVLEARAEAPLVSISLADPKVSLTVGSTRGKIVHVVGAAGLHPLYSCVRLRTPLFGSPAVLPVRGMGSSDEAPFSRPGIDELLDS